MVRRKVEVVRRKVQVVRRKVQVVRRKVQVVRRKVRAVKHTGGQVVRRTGSVSKTYRVQQQDVRGPAARRTGSGGMAALCSDHQLHSYPL